MWRFRTPLLLSAGFLVGLGATVLAQSASQSVTLSPGESLSVGVAPAEASVVLQPGESVLVVADTLPPTTTTTTTLPPATTTLPPTTSTTTTLPPTTSTTTTLPPTTSTTTTTTLPSAGGYVATFDAASSLDGLVFAIADGRGWPGDAKTFGGDHSLPDASGLCGAPTSTRSLTSGAQSPYVIPIRQNDARVRQLGLAYWCANAGGHFMTALDTSGYAHFDFRPDRTFTDVDRVCWDQNITDMGSGKWTEMAVVPLSTFNANAGRMDYTHPDRNGSGQPGGWGLKILNGVFKAAAIGPQLTASVNQTTARSGNAAGSTEDRALRTEHCVTDNGNGTVTFRRGWVNGSTQTATLTGGFPAGEVVVIFSDVNYNPTKRAGNSGSEFTWHWDNLVID